MHIYEFQLDLGKNLSGTDSVPDSMVFFSYKGSDQLLWE
jgi:hypothetical protein